MSTGNTKLSGILREELISALISVREGLTKEDAEGLLDAYLSGEVDPTVAKHADELRLSSKEQEDFLANLSPELKEKAAVERMIQVNIPKVQGVLNLVASGVELKAAKDQIKAGMKDAAALKSPEAPVVPAPSRSLMEAEDLARMRMQTPISTPEYGALLNQQQLNRIYGLQAAGQASGGQGSQLQAFAQSSANQANQQAMQNAAMIGDIRRNAENQFTGIAGQRSQEGLNIAQMKNQQYALQQDEYMKKLMAAKTAESMGRGNRVTAYRNMANTLASPLARAYTGFGDGISDWYNKQRADLAQKRNTNAFAKMGYTPQIMGHLQGSNIPNLPTINYQKGGYEYSGSGVRQDSSGYTPHPYPYYSDYNYGGQ